MSETSVPETLQQMRGVEKLLWIVARLRHPSEGCPWDLKQTHRSLAPYLLEEAYEAVEAIDQAETRQDSSLLKEELGDVLLQVALHSQLAREAGAFDFDAVCDTIADKLVRRHPHVFGTVEVTDAEAVSENWTRIKRAEKRERRSSEMGSETESILDDVSNRQPALSRALEASRRAVQVGFAWPDFDALWQCVMSEYEEFRTETERITPEGPINPALFDRLESEMGDIFFASVNLARAFDIHPEVALTKATTRFIRRFQCMEHLVRERYDLNGQPLSLLEERLRTLDFEAWDTLWREAKILTGPAPAR